MYGAQSRGSVQEGPSTAVHRALAFKIMCVDLNVCKSMLVRGAYDDFGHVWNLAQIHEDKYVVDVVREPGEIYHPETKKPGVTKFANAAAVASSPFL